MLFLYTNADSLPNKLQELKQLIVHLERSPEVYLSQKSNTKTSGISIQQNLIYMDMLNLPLILTKITVELLFMLKIIYLARKTS